MPDSCAFRNRLRPVALAAFCCLAVLGTPPPTGKEVQAEPKRLQPPEPFQPERPFRNLATGGRFSGRGRVVKEKVLKESVILAGYGLHSTLGWELPPGAEAQLLSFRVKDMPVYQDVTALDWHTVKFDGPVRDCQVESLLPVRPDGSLESRIQPFKVDMRGLFPFAGKTSTFVEGEFKDGPAFSARFKQAFDAVRIPVGRWFGPVQWDLLVADTRAHVIRRITPAGDVSTFCGDPHQNGHRDSAEWHDCVRALMTPKMTVCFSRSIHDLDPARLGRHLFSIPAEVRL